MTSFPENFPPNDDEGLYEEPSPRPRRSAQAERFDQIDQALGRIEGQLALVIHRLKIDAPAEHLHPCGFCTAQGGTGCDLCQLIYRGRPTD